MQGPCQRSKVGDAVKCLRLAAAAFALANGYHLVVCAARAALVRATGVVVDVEAIERLFLENTASGPSNGGSELWK